LGRKIVVDLQAALDQLLAAPLQVLETLGNPVYVDAETGQNGRCNKTGH